MAVGLSPPQNLLPVAGIRLGTAEAAIKRARRRDLLVITLDEGSRVSAVFTRNAFCAAPVRVARANLATGTPPRALVVNSGNANAGTGESGQRHAREVCAAVAVDIGCNPTAVLPFSTGVIGQPLPVERIVDAVPNAVADARANGWEAAARAIMTTDTLPKAVSRRVKLASGEVTITGMAKGAGMIRPDMATMLAFIATDAAVEQAPLDALLREVVAESFNCISVDGDTSTNDACALIATGQAETPPIVAETADFAVLKREMTALCIQLAQSIVRDGEGATRFITIEVDEAADEAEGRQVAFTVAQSPLFKTAAFAGDANWGRILAAVGRSGVPDLNIGSVNIFLDDVAIVRAGALDPGYREVDGAAVMGRPEYRVRIVLGRGRARARVWTCDLSYDYVRINAEYRS